MTKAELKKRVCEAIDKRAEEIIAVGDFMFNNPELGYKEHKAADLVEEKFKALGLDYRKGLALTDVYKRQVNMWTSSMMYTLYLPWLGANFTPSRKSRISSIPRLDAPSISNTSRLLPCLIPIQLAQAKQGLGVGLSVDMLSLIHI